MNKSLIKKLHIVRVLELIILGILIIGAGLFVFKTLPSKQKYALIPAWHNSPAPQFGIASTNSTTNCDATVNDADTATAQDFLTQLNAYRASKGSGPVKLSATLMQSAKWQSNDMAQHATMSHVDSLGRDPYHRLVDCGYSGTASDGENVAQGQTSTTEVLQAWQGDAGHDQNLLNPNWKVVGIADVNAYWTMDAGSEDDSTQSGINDTPTITQTTSPTSAPTNPPANSLSFNISALLPGIGKGGNISPNHSTKTFYFTLYDTNNAQVTTWNAPVAYTGAAYTGTMVIPDGIQPGKYVLKVKADGTLIHIVQPTVISFVYGKTVALPQFTLVVGDINGDNLVDHKDFTLFVDCIQNAKCSDKQVEDFNDDASINIADYNLLLRSFASIQGE